VRGVIMQIQAAAPWRRAVTAASVDILCTLLLHESAEGETLAPLMRAIHEPPLPLSPSSVAAEGQPVDARTASAVMRARAAARGESDGGPAAAALVIFRVAISDACKVPARRTHRHVA
jgi:hypothetical protein